MSKALYLYQCKSARQILTYDDQEYRMLVTRVATLTSQVAALTSDVTLLTSNVNRLVSKVEPLEFLNSFITYNADGITHIKGAGTLQLNANSCATQLFLGAMTPEVSPVHTGKEAIYLVSENVLMATANGVYSDRPVRVYDPTTATP